MLDANNIAYSPCVLPNKKLSALEVADFLDVKPELVFKTIVAIRQGKGKPVLALVPATHELDLKSLSRALGEKKVKLASQKDAETLTGLQTGGISPLALMQKGFAIVIDKSIERYAEIYISGGQRGLNLCLPTEALISLTKANIHRISRNRVENSTWQRYFQSIRA
jgi:Cys-tRNA(Pro)/Cys-tRNA(Cys) deacylase